MTSEPLLARVVASHGRNYFVEDSLGAIYEARRKGKKGDVVVGDLVSCTEPVAGLVSILEVQQRRNLLFRSDAWRMKALAANVDLVAVLFASRPSFNPWFVWKALIAAHSAGIEALIVRTKSDLVDAACSRFVADLKGLGETVLTLSVLTAREASLAALRPLLLNRRTLLVGQSGMGKSTLLNALCPAANARTREISEALDLGKQTTTETRLFKHTSQEGTIELIDSPGFQEFGLAHLSRSEILRAMPDIASTVNGCRYYNCTHTKEPGCSVLKALQEGRISAERHAFFVQMTENAKKDGL